MTQITLSRDVFKFINPLMSSNVEEVWGIGLSSEKYLLASELLFRGTVDSCLIHPRDVFRFGCRANASSIIIVHNHPTGRPVPSEEDRKITRRLVDLGRMMEIPIVDHVIVAGTKYFSFADASLIFQSGRQTFYEVFSSLQ